MSINQKNINVVNLVEKGFAVRGHGEATVVCNEDGQPVPMAPKLFPNGAMGGSVTLVKRDAFDDTRARAHVVSQDLYAIAVIINGVFLSVTIAAFDAATLEQRLYEARGELSADGSISLVEGAFCANQEGAWDLITGPFNGALDAAIRRAQDKMPNHLYWGEISPDAREVRRLERQHVAA